LVYNAAMLYAQVIVKQRTQVQELSYALSAQIIPYLRVGSLVEVPLRQKSVLGVVVGFSRQVASNLKGKIREIEKLAKGDGVFSEDQIEVIKQLANYYGAPLAEVAFHALKWPNAIAPNAARASSLPLIVQGPHGERSVQYLKIIERSKGRVVVIFSVKAQAERFWSTLSKVQQALAVLDDGRASTSRRIGQGLVNGKVKIVVGTLSNIFAPLAAGDWLIIDGYRQIGAVSQLRPYLRAQKIAQIRAQVERLRVVLGETLIAVEDLPLVRQRQFRLVASKFMARPLVVIDQRGQSELIAPNLLADLAETVEKGGRALVLVLARGWSSALACRDCGHIFSCDHCHRTAGVIGSQLRCLYCATEADLPKVCPICRSTNLHAVGVGVSRIKSTLANNFPSKTVIELSSDQPILVSKADIVVATEKIFSHPTEKFTKTYIVSADRLLSGAHLDGSWRLLSYILELQNRSERVIVQTYFPDSIVWTAGATGQLRPFFATELNNRRQLSLPPYGAVIGVRGSAATTDKLISQAEAITSQILQILPTADISYPEIDDRSGHSYAGHFTIYLPKPASVALKLKLASLLSPAWHLDID